MEIEKKKTEIGGEMNKHRSVSGDKITALFERNEGQNLNLILFLL